MEALRANRGVAGIATLFAVLAGLALAAVLTARGAGNEAQAGILPPCLPGDTAPPDALANIPNPSETDPGDRKRKVIFVGNNWEGTADVISTHGGKFKTLTRINIVPDYDERVDEICGNPVDLVYFLAIRELVGEGNDQLVDDMYSTPDGKLLVVSRPSFRDVVAIHLSGPDTGNIAWRFQVAGQRSDHMAISPDGEQVAVSASTGNVVHLLNTKTGVEEGTFASGDSPHENTYSDDGSKIYHASIGLVYTPGDDPIFDTNTNKGERYFQVVDADTHEIISQVDMGQKLEEAGYPDMSSAVRPMAITSNERKAFLQVSFFHGVVSYDLKKEKVKRVTRLPNLIPNVPREQYLLDSAHHGIALAGNDKRLCVAGTMSSYATVIKRRQLRKESLDPKLIQKGEKPYWSTTSENGKYCYVSWSGTDDISIISYRKRKEIDHTAVGEPAGNRAHPQRIRNGVVRQSFLDAND
jgi:DNA-binding beta-propeller fold protein YncE